MSLHQSELTQCPPLCVRCHPAALNFTLTLNAEKRKEGRKIIAQVKPAVEIEVAVDIKLNITDGTAERKLVYNDSSCESVPSDGVCCRRCDGVCVVNGAVML